MSSCFLFRTSFDQSLSKYSIKNKKAIRHFEQGYRFYESNNDKYALDHLVQAVEMEPDFIEAHGMLGNIYYDHKKYDKAIAEYQTVIEVNADFFSAIYYNIANAELKAGKYQAALDHLNAFLAKDNISKILEEKSKHMLVNAEFGANAVKSPVPFDPINLGNGVNSIEDEYHPAISADEQMLIITRKIPEGTVAGRTFYTEEFYYSVRNEASQWKLARNMGPPLNTPDNEGAQCIAPDGRWLYFTACDRKNGLGSCDIYTANKIGNSWSVPVNLGEPVNSEKWDSQPSLSSDGKTLYFSSARKGTKGGSDIFMTMKKDNGTWSRPENLNFNTREDEMSPFIHPDGETMYFASKGLPGMGGFDLYVVKKDKKGNFGEPQNLGYPINTTGDEHGVIVGASGEIAYFASDRDSGVGKLDIYSFELYQKARPTKVTYAKGFVYDAKTNQKLGAKFELINLETAQVVVQSFSDNETGEFLVCLPVNRDYALNVSKKGYLFYSENFSLKDIKGSEPFLMKVPLQPIEKGGRVVLKNVFFETAKYDLKPKSQAELNKLVKFLETNPSIKIELSGHTDNVGGKQFNQVLSENRAKAVYEYLVSQNIAPDRLDYKGYGDMQSVASNDTEEGRAQNRRTEFKVIE